MFGSFDRQACKGLLYQLLWQCKSLEFRDCAGPRRVRLRLNVCYVHSWKELAILEGCVVDLVRFALLDHLW